MASRKSIIHSLKWSFLTELSSKLIQPLVFIILARLLTPEDFGVVAAAAMVISFSQIFWEAGMGKAIIQYQGCRITAANTVFWINNVLGIIIAIILIWIAPTVAEYIFQDLRVTAVLQVMSLQILFSAAVSVQTSLFQKDMQFRKLFVIRLFTVSIPGLISIPLALYGLNYWALVAGTIAGQFTQVLILWRICDWRPAFRFDSIIAKVLMRFGGWVAISGLLGWFYSWADSLIIGIYLDAHNLGIYRTGNSFVTLFIGVIAAPLMPVAYSIFCHSQDDINKLRKGIKTFGKALTLISFPIGAALFLTAEISATMIFGSKWAGIEYVIMFVAITQAIAYSISMNQEGYRSIGRPDIETKVMTISMLIRIPFYLVSIHYGLVPFLIARLAATLLGVCNHLIFSHRILKINLLDYFNIIRTAFLGSFIMIILIKFFVIPYLASVNPFLKLALILTAVALIYLPIVLFTEMELIKSLIYWIKDDARKQNKLA